MENTSYIYLGNESYIARNIVLSQDGSTGEHSFDLKLSQTELK